MLNTVDRDHLKASDGDIHICEPQAGLQHLFSHHVGHERDWLIRSSSWRQWGHPAGKCRKLILKKCLQNVEIYSSNLDWLTTINVLSLCITPLIIAHETKKNHSYLNWTLPWSSPAPATVSTPLTGWEYGLMKVTRAVCLLCCLMDFSSATWRTNTLVNPEHFLKFSII